MTDVIPFKKYFLKKRYFKKIVSPRDAAFPSSAVGKGVY